MDVLSTAPAGEHFDFVQLKMHFISCHYLYFHCNGNHYMLTLPPAKVPPVTANVATFVFV